MNELVSKQNRLVGHYLCRGSIDLKRTARKLRIPEGVKGHLSPERFERQKESLGHPDSAELEGVKTAVAGFLAQLERSSSGGANCTDADSDNMNIGRTSSDQAISEQSNSDRAALR